MIEDSLSTQDVIDLANNPSIENKGMIAQKISSVYNSRTITPAVAKLAEDIFRIMIRDTEIKVRETLSNCLKNCSNLPNDVVASILKDTDSISLPFIQYYSSLTDEDLIKIIDSQKKAHQKAVALRKNISSELSDYIITVCPSDVVATLISNEGADIDEKTFNSILDKYPQDETIKANTIYRSELPVSVIEKIIDKISYKLKNHLILNHNLPKDMVSNLDRKSTRLNSSHAT